MAVDIHERIRAIEAVESVQGVHDLAPERAERTARNWSDPVRAGVSYFRIPDRRMPRGRITLLENGQNAMERVMFREYVILQRYGGYHGANHPADWQRNDVYLGIIQRGGLHEFDAEQIVELTWHYRPGREATQSHRLIWAEIDKMIAQGIAEPDAIVAVIPQVAGRDLTIQTCEACGPDRRFKDAESVRQHRAIMHKEDVQTVGTRDAIVQALQAGGGSGSGMDRLADSMAALVEQNRVLMEMLTAQNGAPRRGRPPTNPE
jgi:hypothetical protein